MDSGLRKVELYPLLTPAGCSASHLLVPQEQRLLPPPPAPAEATFLHPPQVPLSATVVCPGRQVPRPSCEIPVHLWVPRCQAVAASCWGLYYTEWGGSGPRIRTEFPPAVGRSRGFELLSRDSDAQKLRPPGTFLRAGAEECGRKEDSHKWGQGGEGATGPPRTKSFGEGDPARGEETEQTRRLPRLCRGGAFVLHRTSPHLGGPGWRAA